MAERRLYQTWSNNEVGPGFVNQQTGIIRCKKLLNDLHNEMGLNGYNQVINLGFLKYTNVPK